ncbi:MAG: hypothetical protein EA353_10425 [Puniceicoccaceae bacterium]|nr:MAG: hypothetical protein EA353_10425 [Puniceicoccaceae bacterium]
MICATESIWRSDQSSYIRLLPSALGVSNRRCSMPLQRAVSDFGFEKSFQQAANGITEHYGFELPLSAVAQVSRKHAAKIALRQSARAKRANALPSRGAEQLIAEADGSFVRIVSSTQAKGDRRKSRQVDYREVRLCACSKHDSDTVRYDATFGPVDSVAALWAQAAKSVGMSTQSRVHVLADGATWIDSQRSVAFGSQGKLLIDLYHVLEYLGQAAETCSTHPKRWLKTQKKRLKSGRSERVIRDLEKHREAPSVSEEMSPVRRAWRYLENRRDYLTYDQAIDKDLPLGSGLIESGNKHVLQARMKIPGASWSMETAENFVRARAMRANQQWEDYWTELKYAA